MRSGATAGWVCALYLAVTFAWYVAWRHFLAERSADEGMFENILWNGVHGSGLRSWIEGGVPHLAVHFSPILYLLLPFYALTGSMHVVHLAVSALTAAAGLVFHRHVRHSLDERSALPAMVAFLMLPTIILQTFMEFHEQSLAILPLTLLLVAWSERRGLVVLVSALALLSVREDNALLLLALGVISVPDAGRRRMGVALLLLGASWLVAWRAIAIQSLGAGEFPGVFANTYSRWGESPGEAMRSVVTRPMDAMSHLMAPAPLKYLVLLLAPVLGLLPFGSCIVLVALPQLMLVLLADHDARQFQIRMHYSVAPAVILMFAAVSTLQKFDPARPALAMSIRRWAPPAMMAVTLLLAPGWALRAAGRLNPYASQIREVLRAVPDTASVSAPGYLLNHLAARPRIALQWEVRVPNTEYVVLEDSSRFFFKGTTVDVFYSSQFDSLLTSGGYDKVLDRHGWHVYRRRAPGGGR